MSWSEWGWYKPEAPKAVKGGIKAKSKKGAFGTKWWAKAWVDALEDLGMGGRLTRGKRYARAGQVVQIDVVENEVSAKVQGTRARPYSVEIKLEKFSTDLKQRTIGLLAAQPLLAASVLSGDFSLDVDEVLGDAGICFVPTSMSELDTYCSCPDWSNPCKHIAAVYYIIAEEIDRDPLLLFRLRGIEREDLAVAQGDVSGSDPYGDPSGGTESEIELEDVPEDPDRFWGSGVDGEIEYSTFIPSTSADLVHQCGSFPFWRGHKEFIPTMDAMYGAASEAALAEFIELIETI